MQTLTNYNCIALGKDASKVTISIEDQTILSINDINVLVATIDKYLKFYKHVSDICCKAVRQINVLSKLHSVLDEFRSRSLIGSLQEFYSL